MRDSHSRHHAAAKAQRSARNALLIIAAGVLAALAVFGGKSAEAATVTVQVGQRPGGSSGNQFNSASITISAGDTVTFVRFAGTHDVQSFALPAAGTAFASASPMSAGTPLNVTFGAAGTYTYYCTIHSDTSEAGAAGIDASISGGNMVGKVVVVAAATSTPTAPAATATSTSTGVPPTATPTAAGATATPTQGTGSTATATAPAATATPTSPGLPTATPSSPATATATASPPTPPASATPVPPAGPGGVTIIDFAFSPGGLSVTPGTAVRWVNTGAKKHTVTDTGASFDSGIMATGDAFTFTFAAAGAFSYYCDLHPEMVGSITVSSPSGPGTPTAVPTAPPTATPSPAPQAPLPPPQPGTVQVVDYDFSPTSLLVTTGASVRWVNVGAKKHTVTAGDGSFDSGLLARGDAFTRTFDRAGVFAYICDLHPEMTGEVRVSESAAPTGSGAAWPLPPGIPSSLLFNEGWDPIAQAWVSTPVTSLDQIASGNASLWTLILGGVRNGTIFARDLPPRIVDFVESQYANTGGPPAAFYTPSSSPVPPTVAANRPAQPGPSAGPAQDGVDVFDYDYSPRLVAVTAGATVRFVNSGKARHTVTDKAGSFDSGFMATGDSYAFTFASPGTYVYFCVIHPEMEATVQVADAAGTVPPPAAVVPLAPVTRPIVPGEVRVLDFEFSPQGITIGAGASVRFTNLGIAPHTVTATDASFDSGLMAKEDSFRYTFVSPGTFQYFCELHPQMTGTVTVLDAAGSAPPPAAVSARIPPLITSLLGPRASAPATGEPRETIAVVDFAYQPPSLSVARGTVVTWTNNGVAPHTVTSKQGAFDSGMMRTGAAFSFTFETNGTFEYLCTYHPDMTARVVVSESKPESEGGNVPLAVLGTGGVPETTGGSSNSWAVTMGLVIAAITVGTVIVIVAIASAEGRSK